MITIEQCRGARGLLGWTQQDLADSSGLSKTAINNFEKGHSDIKYESLKAIRMAFESAGIEFIGLEGLRKRAGHIRTLTGENALAELLDDIHETLAEDGGEILILENNEQAGSRTAHKNIADQLARLKEKNITKRILCPTNTESAFSTIDFCRWLSKDTLEATMPSFIYGSKIAFELWDQSMIIIIDNHETSEATRRRFESLWSKASIPPAQKEKTASQT